MADSFTIEIIDKLTPALEQFTEQAGDFTRVDDEMYAALADVAQDNFDSRGARAGGWPPRKARRSAEPVTHPLMQLSGGLVRSLTRRGAPGAVFEAGRDSVVYGSSLPHALAHQRGAPRRGLPVRRVMPSPEQFKQAVLSLMKRDGVRLGEVLGFDVKG